MTYWCRRTSVWRSITGHPAGPGRVGVSACDIACGMAAHAGVLEALIERGITARGKGLKVSLFDGMVPTAHSPPRMARWC